MADLPRCLLRYCGWYSVASCWFGFGWVGEAFVRGSYYRLSLQLIWLMDLDHLRTSTYAPCHLTDLKGVWAASPRLVALRAPLASVFSSSPETNIPQARSLSYAQRDSSLFKWKSEPFARDMVSVCSREVHTVSHCTWCLTVPGATLS